MSMRRARGTRPIILPGGWNPIEDVPSRIIMPPPKPEPANTPERLLAEGRISEHLKDTFEEFCGYVSLALNGQPDMAAVMENVGSCVPAELQPVFIRLVNELVVGDRPIEQDDVTATRAADVIALVTHVIGRSRSGATGRGYGDFRGRSLHSEQVH
jgi:hypothetical protein